MKLKFILFFLLVSCQKKNQFINVTINLPSYNQSKYEISFQNINNDDFFITYWDEEDNKLNSDSKNKSNEYIVIPFLKPSTNYFFRINSKKNISKLYTFKTHDLPENFPEFNLNKDSLFSFSGYLLFRTQMDPGIQFLMDDEGKIIWYSMSDSAFSRPFNISNEFSYISLSKKNIIHELSYNGDTLLTLNMVDDEIHHEITTSSNVYDSSKVYIGLTYEYLLNPNSEVDSIIGDGISVYNNSGIKIWSWNIFDHVNPYDEKYKIQNDWSHANGVEVDNDGNFLISFRNFSQIWKIDSRSGKILWRLGIDGDYFLKENEIFYSQHAIHKNNTNNYMLFDNGARDYRETSRALVFSLNEKNSVFNYIRSVYLPNDLFTFKQGSVYNIDDEKYLFCSSTNNRIVILNSNGKILWDLESDHSFYRVYYIDKNNLFFNQKN